MNTEKCPLCFACMEPREVAPCMDCGASPDELRHFHEGLHTYAEFRIFDSLRLILCNFCQVDFGSYQPEYFGLPDAARLGFGSMIWIREVNPPEKSFDKVCPDCGKRLAFLRFVSEARQLHQQNLHASIS